MLNIFKKLFNKNEHNIKDICNNIIKIISKNDESTLKRVEKLSTVPEEYFLEYKELYLERGIQNFHELTTNEIIWLGMADILIENNYAEEFDWKCELEDFEYQLKKLKLFELGIFNYESIELDNKKSIENWIIEINKIITVNNLAIIYMDINSDSYVLFPTEANLAEELQKEGNKIGQSFKYYIS